MECQNELLSERYKAAKISPVKSPEEIKFSFPKTEENSFSLLFDKDTVSAWTLDFNSTRSNTDEISSKSPNCDELLEILN